MNALVTVHANSPGQCCTTSETVDGGCNPSRNEELTVEFIKLKYIYYCKTSTRNEVAGEASVPCLRLLWGLLSEKSSTVLSGRSQDPTGERSGIINVSVKVTSRGEHWCCPRLCSQMLAVGVPVRQLGSVTTVNVEF